MNCSIHLTHQSIGYYSGNYSALTLDIFGHICYLGSCMAAILVPRKPLVKPNEESSLAREPKIYSVNTNFLATCNNGAHTQQNFMVHIFLALVRSKITFWALMAHSIIFSLVNLVVAHNKQTFLEAHHAMVHNKLPFLVHCGIVHSSLADSRHTF
jgi:hypothetical protein